VWNRVKVVLQVRVYHPEVARFQVPVHFTQRIFAAQTLPKAIAPRPATSCSKIGSITAFKAACTTRSLTADHNGYFTKIPQSPHRRCDGATRNKLFVG
jgi:hypothetical protein